MGIRGWCHTVLPPLLAKLRRQGWRPKGVREMFVQFQRVLAANNRAMEILSDMGEKLSGDYIFDQQYLKIATQSLTTAVGDSIEALEELTTTPYPALTVIRDRLADQLQDILTGCECRTGPAVLPLHEASMLDVAMLGGKCAHLAEMLHLGFSAIPPGFVITSRSFHDLIDANNLRPTLDAFEHQLANPQTPLPTFFPLGRELSAAILQATPPTGLLAAIQSAIDAIPELAGKAFAVRSSAMEEDMDFSFAGQFQTVLNVPGQPEAIFHAYRQVAASLFSQSAITYRRKVFPGEGAMSIAAGCQPMIASLASGLVFTVDTSDACSERMVIVGAWGQGEAVVEGGVATDTFLVGKGETPVLLERQVSLKSTGRYLAAGGGLEDQPLPAELGNRPCLDDTQIIELARLAQRIEQAIRRPQDIEWTVDEAGRFFILQARPLFIPESIRDRQTYAAAVAGLTPMLQGGRVASLGIGAGPVYRVLSPEDLATFPEGAVLVARRDSAMFAQVLPKAAAVVTEVGTPLSHMATLCREMRVPCLVNVPQLLDKVASGEEITVDTENLCLYRGRVNELLRLQVCEGMDVSASLEFRQLRRIVAAISALHLIDPLLSQFRVEACQSYHDILRFNHETAVQTMVDMGRDENRLLGGQMAKRLALPIPTGILVVDIGGGLTPDAPRNDVPITAINSTPFRAILRGMLCPGVWHNAPMAIGFRDLMNSMFNPAHDLVNRQYTGHNIAIIGGNYVNLCFRLGYHFNIIDAHCGEVEQNNHLFFRFLGGVTDLAKRSRRSMMIAIILRAFEFNVQTAGDLVTARLSHLPIAEMERTLDILGRLVGFTRQLDVQMDSDGRAEALAEAFLNGNYEFVNSYQGMENTSHVP